MENDLTIMWQLKEMVGFCCNHEKLYVWGNGLNQKMLAKYLDMSGLPYSGHVVSRGRNNRDGSINAYYLEDLEKEITNKEEVGFLLGLDDGYFNSIVQEIISYGYNISNIFMLSQHNKRAITYKMQPRTNEEFWVEVNLADHCNLNCQMCDHFSPLANPTFLDIEVFKNDIKRLADLAGKKIGILKLEGGEPLLNDQLIDIIKISRKNFPDAVIFLITNALLLKQWENHLTGNLWKVCHDYNIRIEVTVYPINFNMHNIKELAERYDVCVEFFSEIADRGYKGIKHSVKHPFRLEGDVDRWQFIGCCQFNNCIVLKEGRVYTCPIIPYVHHFNEYFKQNLKVDENDSIDIYKAVSFEQIAEFVSRRADFCRYCDICHRRVFEWKQSRHTIEEYVDLGENNDI